MRYFIVDRLSRFTNVVYKMFRTLALFDSHLSLFISCRFCLSLSFLLNVALEMQVHEKWHNILILQCILKRISVIVAIALDQKWVEGKGRVNLMYVQLYIDKIIKYNTHFYSVILYFLQKVTNDFFLYFEFALFSPRIKTI